MFDNPSTRMLLLGLALALAPVAFAQDPVAERPAPTRLAQETVRPAPVPRPAPAIPAAGAAAAGQAPAAIGQSPSGGGQGIIIRGDRNGAELPELIDLDFKDDPLITVIEQLAPLIGLTFDLDPQVASTPVTIISHKQVPLEMAYPILESILHTRGFSMVRDVDGHLIKIMPSTNQVRPVKDPIYIGLDEIPGDFDATSTHLVSVLYADAETLASTLDALGGDIATVSVYLPTQTLIINGTADALRRMRLFLELVDVPGLGTTTELFFLEYTSADVLAQQLEQVLLDTSGQATGGPGAPPIIQRTTVTPVRTTTTRPTVAATAGGGPPQFFGARQETLRLMADERLNALIAVATAGMMEQVRSLVKQLDTPVSIERQNLHIYGLLNADAEKVQEALQEILSGTSSRRSTPGPGGGAAGGAGGGAQASIGSGRAFDGEVSVTRYEQTNSLLIVASPQDYKMIQSFIAQLDVPQRQVYVDAIVMDVSLTDVYSVGVDAAGLSGNDGFAMTSTANISSLFAVAGAATDIATGARGLAGGLLALGGSGGLTTGVFDDLTIEINGQVTKIPFVPVLFKALETITDIEVLSNPSLVTVDNEEASIAVGQEVPFITSTGSSLRDESGQPQLGSYGGYTRVQREEVGVKMKVTPQITEGDNVLLEIEIEVSEVSSNQVGSVDIVGPTTDKSIITNKVLVRDGSTAVLAGLIRNTADRSRGQAPILGDIPVLGFLFRNKSNTTRKRNMVILVTPHIIKEGVDMERVTDYKVDEYHRTNVQQLLDQGFVRKVSDKYQERKDYRPTYDRAEELTGQRSGARFGRGDVVR